MVRRSRRDQYVRMRERVSALATILDRAPAFQQDIFFDRQDAAIGHRAKLIVEPKAQLRAASGIRSVGLMAALAAKP